MVTLLAVLVGIAAACILAYALAGDREIWDLDEGEGVLLRIKKERERLLRSMKDIETEVEAGTLTAAEGQALRRDFKSRAIAVSRELDRVRRWRLRALEKATSRKAPAGGAGALAARDRNRVEELVAKRRKERA